MKQEADVHGRMPLLSVMVAGVLAASGVAAASDVSGAPRPAAPVEAQASTASTSQLVIPRRLAGSDRFATAARVSAAFFGPDVPAVFVATGEAFPDALAAGPVAAAARAPVLLVGRTSVPAATADELRRLRPGRIVVVGGPAAVSDGTLAELRRHTDGAVTRIAGRSRYETAAALSRSTFTTGLEEVYVATGETFPDALAGGAAAAVTAAPVLLTAQDVLPDATRRELERLRPGRVVVLGGSAAVSADVERQLRPLAGTVVRLAGRDRYETAALTARHAFPGTLDTALLATGTAFPDAVTGGAVAGVVAGPLLLAARDCVPATVVGELDRLGVRTAVVLGGASALGPGVDHQRRCPTGVPDRTYGFDRTDDWALQEGVWRTTAVSGNPALAGDGEGFARLVDYLGVPARVSLRLRLEGRVRQEGQGVNLNLAERFDGGHERVIVTFEEGQVTVSRQAGDQVHLLGRRYAPVRTGRWHQADVTVDGRTLDVLVDGFPAVRIDLGAAPAPGGLSLESFGGGPVTVDDLVLDADGALPHDPPPRALTQVPPGPDVGPFRGGVHEGDAVIGGNDDVVLDHGTYLVRGGNLVVRDDAHLVVGADAVLVFDRGDTGLGHWGLQTEGRARVELYGNLETVNALGTVYATGESHIRIQGARVSGQHIGDVRDHATVEILDSVLVSPLGGGIGPYGQGTLEIVDSYVGHLPLSVQEGERLHARGLAPGYIPDLDLRRDLDTAGIGYEVRITNSVLVEDTMPPGPYERGWVIEADDRADVRLQASTLRKLIYVFSAGGPDRELGGLRIDAPTTRTVAGVAAEDVTVTGQWGIFVWDRQVTVRDSEGVFLFVYGTADVTFVDSVMSEFDPRGHTGTVRFVDSRWDTAGEIIEGNDLRIEGTVEIDVPGIDWESSRVTRSFPVVVRDAQDRPRAGVTVTATRGGESVSAATDAQGRAELELVFTDTDWRTPWQLTSDAGDGPVDVAALTSTPIVLGGG